MWNEGTMSSVSDVQRLKVPVVPVDRGGRREKERDFSTFTVLFFLYSWVDLFYSLQPYFAIQMRYV